MLISHEMTLICGSEVSLRLSLALLLTYIFLGKSFKRDPLPRLSALLKSSCVSELNTWKSLSLLPPLSPDVSGVVFDTHLKMVMSQGGTFEKMKEKVQRAFLPSVCLLMMVLCSLCQCFYSFL